MPLGTEFIIDQVKAITQDVIRNNSDLPQVDDEELDSIVKETMPIINIVEERMNAGDFEGALKQLSLYIDEKIGTDAEGQEIAQELKLAIARMFSNQEEFNLVEEVEASIEHEMEADITMIQHVEELMSRGEEETAKQVIAQYVDTHVQDPAQCQELKDLLDHPEQVQAMMENAEAFAETPEGEQEMEEIVEAMVFDSVLDDEQDSSAAGALLPCMLTFVAILTATLF